MWAHNSSTSKDYKRFDGAVEKELAQLEQNEQNCRLEDVDPLNKANMSSHLSVGTQWNSEFASNDRATDRRTETNMQPTQQQHLILTGQSQQSLVLYLGDRPMPRYSVAINCPNCHYRVYTGTHHQMGTGSWVLFIVLMLFTTCLCLWPFGFCFLPCCVGGCQDVLHTCPACNNVIGTARMMR